MPNFAALRSDGPAGAALDGPGRERTLGAGEGEAVGEAVHVLVGDGWGLFCSSRVSRRI